MTLSAPLGPTQKWSAFLLLIGMAGTVGTALAFEHIGGYIPCMLCLQERIPYYVGAPLMGLAVIAVYLNWPAWTARLLLLLGALLMTIGLGMAIYHSGVEWAWWAGPTSCGAVAPSTGGTNGVLDSINTVIPPSCDKAAGRFLGLSFAGWNVVASALFAVIGYRAAFKR
ncbi:MAG: disulfide bond formation protein B [Mesorhizobium sp.]|nr:disulfide bond formation protein B [Mesorhizobium sp.]